MNDSKQTVAVIVDFDGWYLVRASKQRGFWDVAWEQDAGRALRFSPEVAERLCDELVAATTVTVR